MQVRERSSNGRGRGAGNDLGPDAALAGLAARQRGVVTRAQMRAAGLSDGAIDDRVGRGALHRLHRGVYLVGHPVPPPHALELAGVLGCGPGALVARASALSLWSLPFAREESEPVDVLVVGRRARSRAGLRVRRCAALAPADRTRRHGIPVTAPAWTVVEMAGVLGLRDLEDLVNEVQVRRLASAAALHAVIARAGHRAGLPALRRLLDGAERGVTRNRAERRLRSIVRSAGLPAPETNARLAGYEVDVLWRRHRIVVELDGFAAHGTRRAFERDRRRDAELVAAGYRVLRVTWRQIEEEPLALVARVSALLAATEFVSRS